MNCCKDYARFALCFAGIGYVCLWAVTLHPTVSGAALTLPPAFHVLGGFAALFVVVQVGMIAMRRRRAQRAGVGQQPVASELVEARLEQRWKAPPVKPRSQFGLRGQPR